MNAFDKKIQNSLKEGTNPAVYHKKNIYESIQASKHKKQNHTKKKSFIVSWCSIAALFLVIFFTLTPPGKAAIQSIYDFFAPEKQQLQVIEGQEEDTNVTLHINKQSGYVIYFDAERYEKTEINGKDRIVPIGFDSSYLPDVYMDIYQEKSKFPGQLIEEIKTQLEDDSQYIEIVDNGWIDTPILAYSMTAYGDVANDAGIIGFGPVERIFLVDNLTEGTFIIRQKFFYEAEEGHGQRFMEMLKEFEIIVTEE